MARRSDNSRDEVRQMAIDAGQKLLSEQGFRNFSARAVAKQIGYTIGTIYNIFEDHDLFLLRIHAVTLGDMASFLRESISGKSPSQKNIKILAHAYKKFAEKNYNRWSSLFEYNFPTEKEMPDWYVEKIATLLSIVEEQLVDKIKDKKDAKTSAKVLWAGIHGVCILGLTRRLDISGKVSVDSLIDNLLDNYFDGAYVFNKPD